MQHAVIAIAYPQPIRKRLEMNVRGMRLDRPCDQLIDEPDDRRLARKILEPLRILFRRLGVSDHIGEHLCGITAVAQFGVEPFESRFELDRHRHRHGDGPANGDCDGVARKDVERIGHSNNCRISRRRDRDGANPAQKFGFEPILEQGRVGVIRGSHQRRRNQLRQGFGEPAIAD